MKKEKAKRAYLKAGETTNTRRWSGATCNWEPVGAVPLNPGKLQEIELNKAAA